MHISMAETYKMYQLWFICPYFAFSDVWGDCSYFTGYYFIFMSIKQIKKLIKSGNKVKIQQAIYERWNLKDRPMRSYPYNNE